MAGTTVGMTHSTIGIDHTVMVGIVDGIAHTIGVGDIHTTIAITITTITIIIVHIVLRMEDLHTIVHHTQVRVA